MDESQKIPEPLNLEGNVAENFRTFKQTFERYLAATGKSEEEDEIKLALFSGFIGRTGLDIYKNLEISDEDKHSYDKVTHEFEQVVNGTKANVFYHRYLFYSREQAEGESVVKFVQDVLELKEKCGFKPCCIEEILKIKIIHGINDNIIKKKLINNNTLDLQTLLELCQISDCSSNNKSDVLSERDKNSEVDNIEQTTNPVTPNRAEAQTLALGPKSSLCPQDKSSAKKVLKAAKTAAKSEQSKKASTETSPGVNRNELKLSYKKDQWSPSNPCGKKVYSREFLMALRDAPASKRKPDNILDVLLVHYKTPPPRGGMHETQAAQYVQLQPMYISPPNVPCYGQRPPNFPVPPSIPMFTGQHMQSYQYNRPPTPPQPVNFYYSKTDPLQSTQPAGPNSTKTTPDSPTAHITPQMRNKRRFKAITIIDPDTGTDRLNEIFEEGGNPPSGESSARHTPQLTPPSHNKEVQAALVKQVMQAINTDLEHDPIDDL